MAQVGIFGAMLCVLAPISVPVGDVPLSLATLVILIASATMGPWKSAASVIVYLAAGCLGLPVFSGFCGGAGRLIGPTGGFLAGYLILAVVAGFGKSLQGRIAFAVVGTALLYGTGVLWYSHWADVPMWTAATVCVVPCIPADIGKIAVAAIAAQRIRKV